METLANNLSVGCRIPAGAKTSRLPSLQRTTLGDGRVLLARRTELFLRLQPIVRPGCCAWLVGSRVAEGGRGWLGNAARATRMVPNTDASMSLFVVLQKPRHIMGPIIDPIDGFDHQTKARGVSKLLCCDRVETCTLLRAQCDHARVARYPSKGSNNINTPRSNMTSLRSIPTAVFTVSLETGLLSAFSDSAVR